MAHPYYNNSVLPPTPLIPSSKRNRLSASTLQNRCKGTSPYEHTGCRTTGLDRNTLSFALKQVSSVFAPSRTRRWPRWRLRPPRRGFGCAPSSQFPPRCSHRSTFPPRAAPRLELRRSFPPSSPSHTRPIHYRRNIHALCS